MKKYGKILSVLLCLVVLFGVINMVATAQETDKISAHDNSIKQGTIYEPVSPKRLTTGFGYYSDKTGDDESTFVDRGEGKFLTDGWYGRAGFANCTYREGQMAAVINVDSVINLGRIEIVANDNGREGDGDLIDFDIQAWVNGAWVQVASERNYIFDETRSAVYTFEAVRTSKVRILIYNHYEKQPKMKEITLFEVNTGDLKKTINLKGKVGESDAGDSYLGNCLVDNNKATAVTFTDALIDVDTTGKGVVIDGFVLYPYRADGAIPREVTISILIVGGKRFDVVGTYATGWKKDAVLEPLTITFDRPYVVTAVVVNIDTGAVSDFELFQYMWENPVEIETVPPTSKPTEAPTAEPTDAPTEPTAAPTEPTAAPTEPTVAPTEPPAAPTEPEVTEPEITEPEVTEPEVTEPEETEPEATEPEATEPEATEATEPTDPTEPSVSSTEPTQAPEEAKDSGNGIYIVLYIVIGLAVVAVAVAVVVTIKSKKK